MSEDDKLDLDAWEPQLPPSDFAERVLGRVRAEGGQEAPETSKAPAQKPRRWGRDAGVVSALALAAALLIRATSAPDAHGRICVSNLYDPCSHELIG